MLIDAYEVRLDHAPTAIRNARGQTPQLVPTLVNLTVILLYVLFRALYVTVLQRYYLLFGCVVLTSEFTYTWKTKG